MSTNFYWTPGWKQVLRYSDSPLKGVKQLHIGKQSGGWAFSFQAYVFDGCEAGEREVEITDWVAVTVSTPKLAAFAIKSWADWKALLSSGTIVDEYDRPVSFDEFVEKIEGFLHPTKGFWGTSEDRQPLMNQFDYLVKDRNGAGGSVNPETDWKDAEGYSFTTSNFS